MHSGHLINSSCTIFGNSLDPSNSPAMASSSYSAGTYGAVGSPLQCAGSATRWNVCYYPTSGSTTASGTLVVYRKVSDSTRGPVPGSSMTVSISGSTPRMLAQVFL